MTQRFTITRTKDGEWCQAQIELRERNGNRELSICGSSGYVITKRQARAQALEYWISFFEDQPEEIASMNERMGTRFRSPRTAAKYVLDTDGEFHGLDVDLEQGGKVWIVSGCGQITSELREWFPELIPLLRWHLNGRRKSCIHQHLKGQNYNTHPGIVCENVTCGVKLGHAWNHWPLPDRVVAAVETLRALAN